MQKLGGFLVESDKKVVWEIEDWPFQLVEQLCNEEKRHLPYSGFFSNLSILSAIVRSLFLRLYFR